jgi:sulfur relay (sulfurtransferase) DsrC/TusE family protein
MDVKIKLPIVIDGNAIIRGQFTELNVSHAVFTEVDEDGYGWLKDVLALPARSGDIDSAHERLGIIVAKRLTYEVFRAGTKFQVVIKGGKSRRQRVVDPTYLLHIFDRIPAEGSTFCKIRRESKKVVDALHLKSALAILEIRGLVACTRESNRCYYRRVRGWSLDMHK